MGVQILTGDVETRVLLKLTLSELSLGSSSITPSPTEADASALIE